MALQVWLPLTKDLRQQGLANTSPIILASGNELMTGGKIGNKAIHLIARQSILSNSSCMSGKKQMSYAFWVKVNTTWSTNWLDGIRWVSTDGTTTHVSRQEFYTNCTRVGTWFQGSSISGYVFDPEVWTHLAATFDYSTGKAAFYINGVLQGSSSALDTTHYCRGDFYIGDDEVDILENDVRIYDHCLSPMEVKELSKGLVLHYPLNRQGWGQENLILHTHFNESDWWTGNSSSATVSDSKVTIQASGEFYQKYSSLPTTSIPAGTQLTLSCYFYENTISTGNHRIYYASSPGWKYVTIPANFTGLFTSTFTTTEELTKVTIDYDTRNMTAGKWVCSPCKLEKGPIATPWCPNSADELTTTMGLNGATEYDCSGYCNNGTRIGTFTWTSDTPKYNVSQYFDGSSYIKTLPGDFPWTNFEQITIAAWMKPTTAPNNYIGSIGIAHDGGASNKVFSISNYGGKFTVHTAKGSYVNTQSTYTCPLNEWHYYVATLDGTTCKMYVDGILNNTFTVDWGTATNHSSPQIQVGVDLPGSDEIYTGYYSDVRIYATALTADDVKSLYQNCATIDSNGTIYGQIR